MTLAKPVEPTRGRDGLYVQYQELEAQRRGISPKLSLYATLTKQMEEIGEKLGGQEFVNKTKGVAEVTSSTTGARMRIALKSDGLTKNYALANLKCSHQRKEKCVVPSCKNTTQSAGKCKSCKRSVYRNYCHKHNAGDLK